MFLKEYLENGTQSTWQTANLTLSSGPTAGCGGDQPCLNVQGLQEFEPKGTPVVREGHLKVGSIEGTIDGFLKEGKAQLQSELDYLKGVGGNLLEDYVYKKEEEEFTPEQLKIVEQVKADPKLNMTIGEIVESEGLSFEYHNVTTEDGYILEVHRVYSARFDPNIPKPVAFFQHGILSQSEAWVLNGPNAAAQKFAREGYDVWLGNSRGGIYSRKHQKLNPDDPKDQKAFFDYSFFDMAKYDEPAMIDYVLETTGQQTLSYIAHSQGTTLMFAALAEDFGNLNDKLNLFVALAPVAYLQDSTDALMRYATDFFPYLQKAFKELEIYELFGSTWSEVQDKVCILFQGICGAVGFQNVALDPYVDTYSATLQNMRRSSALSVKQLLHFAEIKMQDSFQQYDYKDPEQNAAHYGKRYRKHVPKIDLSQVSKTAVPIAMFVGKQDPLATVKNALRIKNEIGRAVFKVVFLDDCNHATFNLGKLPVLDDVLKMVKDHNPLPYNFRSVEGNQGGEFLQE